MTELSRFATPQNLAEVVAADLTEVILSRPDEVTNLGVTSGDIAELAVAELGLQLAHSPLDPAKLELWWTDEMFVPTGDPDRQAGRILARLAGRFPLDPSRTHPMPAADGVQDAQEAALAYAKEFGDTTLDVCLLTLGADGHVASLFGGHASVQPTGHRVIPVHDAPELPTERTSLSLEAINSSHEVWILASGIDVAKVLPRAMAGDEAIPAGLVHGAERTRWYADAEAATELDAFVCSF